MRPKPGPRRGARLRAPAAGISRRAGERPARARARILPAVLALAAAAPAGAQLSPGPLSRAHAELEGAAGCLECHAPRRGVVAEKCLECHRPLARRIAAGAGLHARPDHRRCETCHIEHHGRDFELIFWG